MQSEITKQCADSLRSFAQTKFGIQLKSSHAHELVAAYMGYSSRAALLADSKCPITNLRQANILVLTPTASIKERRTELKGLPENLPNDLAEGVYLYIMEMLTTLFRAKLTTGLADFWVAANAIKACTKIVI